MRPRGPRLRAVAILSALTFVPVTPAAAQGDALAGKSVQMIIGFGPGGGYDLWGRTVGRHIGRHLPGTPTVIPQNMPGAGSYAAASYIFNIAPKDGSVLGIIARDAALGPLSGATGARFDPTRLSWIGTPTKENNVCIAYHTAQVKSVQGLFEKQLIVGDTGPGTGTRSYPKALNELIGTKFKLVRDPGRPTSSWRWSRRGRGHLRKPRQHQDPPAGLDPDEEEGCDPVSRRRRAQSELKDVPFVPQSRATSAEKQAIEFLYAARGSGRPFVALRTAVRPAEDAARRVERDHAGCGLPRRGREIQVDLEPEDGEHLAALDRENLAMPKPIVDRKSPA